MKVLLLEDEEPASKRLQKLLLETDPSIQIVDVIVSVSSAIKWLKTNPCPDLLLSDIQLADGISFDVFKAVEIKCPIIFTTAYDQYAIEAFKVNSIDYLLKPIKKDDLEKALAKFNKMNAATTGLPDLSKLLQTLESQQQGQDYKKRFVVRYGEHIKTIQVEDIAFFYTEDKVNFLTTKEGRRFTIDFNLDSLEAMLDPKVFFRINRQYIIAIYAIKEMFAYTKKQGTYKITTRSQARNHCQHRKERRL
jgi:DNA-binding LytR/AlgR family response regulator